VARRIVGLVAALARIVGLVAALAAVAAIAAGSASADGDPASDILLGTDVFYPYTPVAKATEAALDAATAMLRRDRSPVKVAIVASTIDLGVITALFDRAQRYAAFLEAEISFTGPQPLLVVMPSGYGTQHLTPAAVAAVTTLPKPSGASAEDLTRAALRAVDAIGAAEGHRLPGAYGAGAGGAHAGSAGSGSGGPGAGSGGPGTGSGGSSAGTAVLAVGLAIVALLAAGALVRVTLRPRVAGPRLSPSGGGRRGAPAARRRRSRPRRRSPR
jgi:hypothetical protein